jgi:ABC-type spermidine/putrescine transport system permease subunit I
MLLVYPPAYGQVQMSPIPATNFWNSLDTYIKVVAGVVAAITAILGVPVAFLQIRKTIAEIRKTELEAKKLQEQTGGELPTNL